MSTARSALTFSSRMPWASMVAGGSIRVSASTCRTWFCTMSRSAPGRLVEAAAVPDAERLGHGDLHVVDVAPVPDRLEDGVGEAQGEDVLDGLLPEVVVDAVHLRLVEHGVHGGVELVRAVQVAAVRLLDDDPHECSPPAGWLRPAAQGVDDLGERWGRWPGSRCGCRPCRGPLSTSSSTALGVVGVGSP